MSQVHFFADKGDILRVLQSIEQQEALRYVEVNHYPTPEPRAYGRAAELPTLGEADSESGISCRTYLVAATGTLIVPRLIPKRLVYAFDQLYNPDTVALTPAGLLGERVILAGRVATASDSPESVRLMKLFSKVVKREFRKVRAFWVGPAAYELFTTGARLTIALQSPPEYDLAEE